MTKSYSSAFLTVLISVILLNSCNLSSYLNSPPAPPDYTSAIIKLFRDPLFVDTLPGYNVTVTGDGSVLYEGYSNVDVKGQATSQIPVENVIRLVDEFYRIDFFTLKENYISQNENMVGDSPTNGISISINGEYKQVYFSYGGPAELLALADLIDEIAGTSAWVGDWDLES